MLASSVQAVVEDLYFSAFHYNISFDGFVSGTIILSGSFGSALRLGYRVSAL